MNLGPLTFKAIESKHLQPGQAAAIMLTDSRPLGTIGRLADSVGAAYKFRQPVYVTELNLSALLTSSEKAAQYQPLPRYPSVVRDVTLFVMRTVTLDDLLRAVAAQSIEDCRGARLVGTYEGPGVPEDKRNVTLRIEYRSGQRTLRDDEIEERQQRLINALCQTFSAEQH